MENACARLCLLTRAAWTQGLPAPMTRPMVSRMIACGALRGLVLRDVPEIGEALYARARALLARAKDVGLTLEAYFAAGYDVLLPGDARWPRRLYALREQMPQFLFVRGNQALLGRQAVAVAGSRRVPGATLLRARRVGERLACEGLAMVCGGARGVDDAAQQGLLASGGALVLVPAVRSGELLGQPGLGKALAQGNLLIASDTLPDDPFSPQRAIARNHVIYAMGGAALVLAAREGVGGSWHGATDCLRGGYTPVFVPGEELRTEPGSRALRALGARTVDLAKPLGGQLFSRQQISLFGGEPAQEGTIPIR